MRKDRFGNEIRSGKSSHKISFRDKVGQGKLKDIYAVDSYKEFNKPDDIQENANVTCKCAVF